MYKFNSKLSILGSFPCDYPVSIIKDEPQFFNADLDYAFEKGGPITRNFVEHLPNNWQDRKCIVVDSRVHMLMAGWYPCIPGFHHDDVPRSTENGQPNYDNPEYLSNHLMGLVNGEICPTKFAVGCCELEKPPENVIIYKKWHLDVVELLKQGKLNEVLAKSGQYIEFDWQSFHTGQAANASGWRWFIRLSQNTDRIKKITNEIRHQTQVYLEFPMEGW